MSNLYEISGSLAKINDELEANGGELTLELETLLDECSLAFKEKAESIGKWRLNLAGQIEALKKEETRLEARRKATEHLSDRLMEYIKTSMEVAGVEKLDFDSFSFRLQKNPPSVDVWNEKEVPAKYITIKTETVIDKKAILADLKNGVEVSGAILQAGRKHLRQR